jgi:hypothetical protein
MKIIKIHKCKLEIGGDDEGVELLCEEERGITKRTYIYSVIITKEDFKKIGEILNV